VQHVQAIGLIGGLDLAWPTLVTSMMAYLSFDFLEVPTWSCFFPPPSQKITRANQQEFIFNYVVCSVFIGILGICSLALCTLHLAKRYDAADDLELACSVIFSLPLATSWRSIASLLDQSASARSGASYLLQQAAECDDSSLCRDIETSPDASISKFQANAHALNTNAHALNNLASIGLGLGVTLIVLQGAFAARFALNLLAFRRGVRTHTWYWVLRRWKIPPRRLAKRCAYLRGHVASHAMLWEACVWVRQVLLLGMGVGLRETIHLGRGESASAITAIARYGWSCGALLILLVYGCAQEWAQPYALRVQNRLLARWLVVSNALLVLLGMVFTTDVLYDTTSGARFVEGELEGLLITLILLDVVVSISAAAFVLLREYAVPSVELDLSDVLAASIKPIDDPLVRRLLDGTVRLLCSAWLISEGADLHLLHHQSTGAPLLRRRQDLPEDAFVSCAEAAAMLQTGDRSVLALSHVRGRQLEALASTPHSGISASLDSGSLTLAGLDDTVAPRPAW
jgi:hypothetical protein